MPSGRLYLYFGACERLKERDLGICKVAIETKISVGLMLKFSHSTFILG